MLFIKQISKLDFNSYSWLINELGLRSTIRATLFEYNKLSKNFFYNHDLLVDFYNKLIEYDIPVKESKLLLIGLILKSIHINRENPREYHHIIYYLPANLPTPERKYILQFLKDLTQGHTTDPNILLAIGFIFHYNKDLSENKIAELLLRKEYINTYWPAYKQWRLKWLSNSIFKNSYETYEWLRELKMNLHVIITQNPEDHLVNFVNENNGNALSSEKYYLQEFAILLYGDEKEIISKRNELCSIYEYTQIIWTRKIHESAFNIDIDEFDKIIFKKI